MCVCVYIYIYIYREREREREGGERERSNTELENLAMNTASDTMVLIWLTTFYEYILLQSQYIKRDTDQPFTGKHKSLSFFSEYINVSKGRMLFRMHRCLKIISTLGEIYFSFTFQSLFIPGGRTLCTR